MWYSHRKHFMLKIATWLWCLGPPLWRTKQQSTKAEQQHPEAIFYDAQSYSCLVSLVALDQTSRECQASAGWEDSDLLAYWGNHGQVMRRGHHSLAVQPLCKAQWPWSRFSIPLGSCFFIHKWRDDKILKALPDLISRDYAI